MVLHGFRDKTGGNPAKYVLIRQPGRGKPSYKLGEQFSYTERDKPTPRYVVPKDGVEFTTDLASIPGFATWLVPRDGTHTPAALLHDALVNDLASVQVDRHQADSIFRDAMGELGVAFLRRWMMWTAVSLQTLVTTGRWWKRAWYALVIALTILISLWLSGVASGDLLHGDLSKPFPYLHPDTSWRPAWSNDLSLLGFEAKWLIPIAVVLWLRHIGIGIIALAAVTTFGLPLLIALVAFGVYFIAELLMVGPLWVWKKSRRLPGGPGVVNPPRIYGVDIKGG
ncbi:MAG TPA: DUF1353 domain-containing protein [Frankiaceae bacterium]|nr:DUF1353 domain-containing protein [Frankiaceae bacterium]